MIEVDGTARAFTTKNFVHAQPEPDVALNNWSAQPEHRLAGFRPGSIRTARPR